MFGVTTEIAPCPWNEEHYLMMVGMRTEAIDMSEAPDSNLVFLLDVSGSMSDNDKLPLLQESFKELVNEVQREMRRIKSAVPLTSSMPAAELTGRAVSREPMS